MTELGMLLVLVGLMSVLGFVRVLLRGDIPTACLFIFLLFMSIGGLEDEQFKPIQYLPQGVRASTVAAYRFWREVGTFLGDAALHAYRDTRRQPEV